VGVAGAAVAERSQPRWRRSSYSCLPLLYAQSRAVIGGAFSSGSALPGTWYREIEAVVDVKSGETRRWGSLGELFFSRRHRSEVWRNAEAAGARVAPVCHLPRTDYLLLT